MRKLLLCPIAQATKYPPAAAPYRAERGPESNPGEQGEPEHVHYAQRERRPDCPPTPADGAADGGPDHPASLRIEFAREQRVARQRGSQRRRPGDQEQP